MKSCGKYIHKFNIAQKLMKNFCNQSESFKYYGAQTRETN